MVEVKLQLDNDDHYEGGNNPQYLVIHATGNSTDSDESNANYFCTGSRGASAHYFVDGDSITQVVKDGDSSWHCGDGKGAYGITNKNSIGIEMCETNYTISEATISNTIDLVKVKMQQYGISLDNVVRHYDASRKICPEPWYDNGNWNPWFEFKERLGRAVNNTWKLGWNKNTTGRWYCTNVESKYYYKDSWELIDNDWYYFNADGYALCDKWIQDNSNWYYLKDNCKMAKSEWVWDDGECYCFNEKGIMYSNCKTPDGFTVDSTGAWVQ